LLASIPIQIVGFKTGRVPIIIIWVVYFNIVVATPLKKKIPPDILYLQRI
jgi:hypothetical protein